MEDSAPDGPELRTPPGDSQLADAAALLAASDSIWLASVDDAGRPHASHAPVLMADGALHVFVSALARHSANLAQQKQASVLLMREQPRPRQPFARERLGLDCDARVVGAGAVRERLLDAMQARFGPVVSTLRGLADFALFRLDPRQGQYVQGFGRAHALDDASLVALFRRAESLASQAQPRP